ncbi:MAG: [Fe-S]-binding protein [Desulfovibrio sp.]|nr:[Fe-S]-binding protein [Desulfovibrio sp.]
MQQTPGTSPPTSPSGPPSLWPASIWPTSIWPGIRTARRVSQGFFLALFLWFCVATSLGAAFWQLRGWPVHWLLSLDPLTALGTVLSTHAWYAPLFWAVPVIALTAFLGRFFCGFACPLGALNQMTGWLARRKAPHARRVAANSHSPRQSVKYALLAFTLAAAACGLLVTGILDPLPLLFRSINLTLLPVLDSGLQAIFSKPRHYASAWLVGGVLLAILGLNLLRPRFFCRFVCPLGALFGLLARFSPWRIGKTEDGCGECDLCEAHCEGGCRPSGVLVTGECVLCLNCLDRCPRGRITFAGRASAAGEEPLPQPARRDFLFGLAAGALAAPLWSLGGLADTGRNPLLIRPPGALDEDRFLERCIRCGQCMRICPTNVLQPALLEGGVQGIWTPVLNNRLGSSGCQVNCVACGHVCPTAAIRPLSLDEKLGRGQFTAKGPVRLGTAFVDRSRCLPWAMDRPCLVCQELCPVSPKSIYTRTEFVPIRFGQATVAGIAGARLTLEGLARPTVNLGSGDYFLRPAGVAQAELRRIASLALQESGGAVATLDAPSPSPSPSGGEGTKGWKLAPGGAVEVLVRLQKPYVDAARCIGCGVCEHECPISGLRGIRVTFENETRSGKLLL